VVFVPGGQTVHVAAPALEYLDVLQLLQMEGDEAPISVLLVPAGQRVHEEAPY